MSVDAAQGERFFSVIPDGTGDVLAFTATLDTEMTRLYVCNTSSGALTFRLHHVDAGGSVSLGNALFYDKSIPANDTEQVFADATNSGIQLKAGEMIYVRASSADLLAFNGYGVTASIAPEI